VCLVQLVLSGSMMQNIMMSTVGMWSQADYSKYYKMIQMFVLMFNCNSMQISQLSTADGDTLVRQQQLDTECQSSADDNESMSMSSRVTLAVILYVSSTCGSTSSMAISPAAWICLIVSSFVPYIASSCVPYSRYSLAAMSAIICS
jgi:hypothetical protein